MLHEQSFPRFAAFDVSICRRRVHLQSMPVPEDGQRGYIYVYVDVVDDKEKKWPWS